MRRLAVAALLLCRLAVVQAEGPDSDACDFEEGRCGWETEGDSWVRESSAGLQEAGTDIFPSSDRQPALCLP